MAFTHSWVPSLCYCMLLLWLLASQLEQGSPNPAVRGDSVEGDQGEVSGKSNSAISTFRRLELVCTKVSEHFSDMLDNQELTPVYREFDQDLQTREKAYEYYYHKKLVPSKQDNKSILQTADVQ